MSKHALNIMLLVALISGMAVFIGIYRYMTPEAIKSSEAEVEIVIAKVTVERGMMLEPDYLDLQKVRAADRPSGAFRRKSAVVGRISKETIEAGAVVTEDLLVPQGRSSVLTMLKKGYRAVTVTVDGKQEVDRFLAVGDRVDVVVTVGDSRKEDASSKLVLQNVEVLMIPNARPEDSRRSQVDMPVTLAVLPADAEKLSLAMSIGKIQLLVRGYEDTALTGTSGVTQDTLLPVDERNYEAASTYRAVEVIKGVERSKERFHNKPGDDKSYYDPVTSMRSGSPLGGVR